jgi:hypothetical protein
MQEITDSGTNSTDKCNDTSSESTPNTLIETPKASETKGKPTRSKRPASVTNVSNAVSNDPPPRYLASELHQLSYQFGETRYQADDTEHMFAWMFFVDKWADIKSKVDWEDLETRAHFLNMLYVWCEQNNTPFPLENINEPLKVSEDKPASQAS